MLVTFLVQSSCFYIYYVDDEKREMSSNKRGCMFLCELHPTAGQLEQFHSPFPDFFTFNLILSCAWKSNAFFLLLLVASIVEKNNEEL